MSYYKKYSGGGFYDKKSGRWISSTRAHQRVGESIGGWTKRRARDGSYYMERDDDWDDDDDDWDYDWDDDDDDEWERQKAEQKKRERQRREEARERQRREEARERQRREEARERQRREEKKEREYVSTYETALKAKTLSEHREAARLFKQLGCYKDAELYYAHHQTIVSEMQKRAGRVVAFTSFTIFLSSTSWLVFTAQTEGILLTILMAIVLGWWFPPFMGLVGTVAGLIDARAKADDGGEESEVRWMMGLAGIGGSLLALGASVISANLLLTIISIGQLVGGVSCIINGSSKSGAATKCIIASISYLIMLAAIGIYALKLL